MVKTPCQQPHNAYIVRISLTTRELEILSTAYDPVNISGEPTGHGAWILYEGFSWGHNIIPT